MLTIITDVQITRRKHLHMVVDESGHLLLAARTIEQAIVWLIDQAHRLVLLQPNETLHYMLDLTPKTIGPIRITAPDTPHPI